MKNHTWLGITNERQENVYFLDYELRPLETMTISIWPDTSGYKSLGGVYINREPAEYRGGKECTTYSMGKFPSGRLYGTGLFDLDLLPADRWTPGKNGEFCPRNRRRSQCTSLCNQ